MAIWQQDEYLKAWNFASKIHNGQKLPGTELPYINHIGLVAMEASAAIAQNSAIKSPDLLISCALLHDAIEDTSTSYQQIESVFSTAIADGVLALTKDKKLPSKTSQMEDSIERIQQQPKEIWMVKLCDRITNLQPPPKHWNREKIEKYKNEAEFILLQLGEANQFLAQRLQSKIESYHQYL